MTREKLKFWPLAGWYMIFFCLIAGIFLLFKYYSHQDSIIAFVPAAADYYLHLDITGYQGDKLRAKVIDNVLNEFGWSRDFKKGMVPLVNHELALVYLPREQGEDRLLLVRTNRMRELVNLIVAENLYYQLINERLIVLSDQNIDRKFVPKNNQFFARLNLIKPAGRLFFWGYVDRNKLINSLVDQENFFNPGIVRQDGPQKFVFAAQREPDQTRIRFGQLSKISGQPGGNENSQITTRRKTAWLLAEVAPDTNLVMVLDNLWSLEKYVGLDGLTGLIQQLAGQYRLGQDLVAQLMQSNIQLNFRTGFSRNDFLIVLAPGQIVQQQVLDNALKNIIAFQFPQEEILILPDGTPARELRASLDQIERDELRIDGYTMIIYKHPTVNYELAYALKDNAWLVANSSDFLRATLAAARERISLTKRAEACFSTPAQDIIYLNGIKEPDQLPPPLSWIFSANAFLATTEKGSFSGLEGCFY